jgi:multimeric flavodoxin WrbA
MKITLINLMPASEAMVLEKMQNHYKSQFEGAQINVISLGNESIKDCIGCWNCWVKTPGVCIHKDVMSDVYKEYLESDRVAMLLPTKAGFISGSAKVFIDRIIPIYHPYIDIIEGEMMHYYRYNHYPLMDFYWSPEGLSAEEDQVIEDYCYRSAHHFRVSCDALRIQNDKVSVKTLTHREPKPDQPWQALKSASDKKVILYNGSPRGTKSNSLILINEIIKGLKKEGLADEDIEIRNLIEQKNFEKWAADFHSHERHLFVFPLYVHSMPSIVMKFFEKLTPLTTGSAQMAFIVQSGFMESYQSTYLRAYLSILPKRLNMLYGGTLIKGGIEGIQIRPVKSTQKLFRQFEQLGQEYIQLNVLPQALAEQMASPAKLKMPILFLVKLLKTTGILNSYWDSQLKKNGAFENRFDKPYGQ